MLLTDFNIALKGRKQALSAASRLPTSNDFTWKIYLQLLYNVHGDINNKSLLANCFGIFTMIYDHNNKIQHHTNKKQIVTCWLFSSKNFLTNKCHIKLFHSYNLK